MLHLLYSNRFEELAAALGEDLAAARAGGALDLFAPQVVVVPNAMVGSALKLALARRHGIAANLQFPFFDGFVADLVTRARPTWRVLDRPLIQSLLVSLLDDPTRLAGDDLGPVRSYLAAADGEGGGGAGAGGSATGEVRRVQLAGELASLFLEYSRTRPEMMAAWLRGEDVAGGGHEPWQRRLWRELCGDGGLAGPDAGPLAALAARLGPGQLQPPARVHMVGLSTLARAYRPLLARLAQATELLVYSLNPCREFWDDVAGRAAVAGGAAAGGAIEDDAAPLVLWGRPGREHIAALTSLTEGDFTARFVDPLAGAADDAAAPALLRLQHDLLTRARRRRAHDRPARATGDSSVQILACPGVRRELETIGNHIAAALLADPSLTLADVVVLLAPEGCERYQALVGAVFEEIGLPCRLADLPLESESRVVEALDLLLDLPLGRFTRPELLGLMVHPAVLARHPDVDPVEWIDWCAELGIVHGADQSDHEDTYIGNDVYNWDQGLKRLALGAYMGEAPDGGPLPVRLGAQLYVPAEVEPDARPSAARFALLARSLIGEARACRAARRTLTGWAAALDRWAADVLGASSPGDERALGRCREALRRLAALDLDGREVGYATARELLREGLTGQRLAGGEVPTDALLVAPLTPMRPLPFRRVFVAGLDAGRFPAGERPGGFDVRAVRREGDVTPRDRDRYAFLETVLSARQQLVLSYVARDEETGEALEPSSVVHELVDLLTEGYLAPEDAAGLVAAVPLRRFAGGGGRDPVSRRQQACAELRRDLCRHCAAEGAPLPSQAELVAELGRPARRELAARLGLPLDDRPHIPNTMAGSLSTALPAPRGSPSVNTDVVLPLGAVRRFLESPLQAWATYVLGLSQTDDEDRVAQRDEPFERGALALTIALRDVFLAHLLEGSGDLAALEQLHRERSLWDQRTGLSPTGPFATGADRRGAAILRAWSGALDEVSGGGAVMPSVTGFGSVDESDRTARLARPLSIEAAGRRVELVGRTGPHAAGVGSLVLVTGDIKERHFLRGAVDQIALAAAGLADGPAQVTLLSGKGAGKSEQIRLAPLSPEEAGAVLAGLIDDLFSRPHDYLLPCEAAVPVALGRGRGGRRSGDPAADLRDAIVKLRDGDSWFSSRGGPLRVTSQMEPPADAAALVARRFGPWLSRGQGATDG